MRRSLVLLAFFVRSALRGLAASPVTTGVAVATLAVALVLPGAFLLLGANMGSLLERFGRELVIAAYLRPAVGEADRTALLERARRLPGVSEARLVTPEQALERLRARLGEGGLLEGLESNPLPASIEIRVDAAHRTPQAMERIVASLRRWREVEEVGGGQRWVTGYARALAVVRGLGLGIGIVLGLATLLIVANTIRLALYARRDELEILSLVGASRALLRVPFLLEGALQGLFGGLLAIGILFVLFHALVPRIRGGLELLLGWGDPAFLSQGQLLLLLAGGGALGLLGALAALASERRP